MTFLLLNLAWEFGIQDSQKSILQHCQQYSPDFYLHVSVVEAIKTSNIRRTVGLKRTIYKDNQKAGGFLGLYLV